MFYLFVAQINTITRFVDVAPQTSSKELKA